MNRVRRSAVLVFISTLFFQLATLAEGAQDLRKHAVISPCPIENTVARMT